MPALATEHDTLLGPSSWTRTLPPGETLFHEGDHPTAVYRVQAGFVKLTWAAPGGRETISELDLPSAFDGCPYPLTCKAPFGKGTFTLVNANAILQLTEAA